MLLIYGDDQFLIDIQTKKRLPKNGDVLILDGMSTTKEEILNYLMTPCFLEESKTLLLKNALMFTRTKKKNKNLSDEDMLDILGRDFDNQLIISAPKVDKVKKIYKLISKNGDIQEVKPLNEQQLYDFTKKTMDKKGINIEDAAIRYLSENVENSLSKLVNYIQQLQLVDEELNLEVVKQIVPKSYSKVAFDMTNAMFKNNVNDLIGTWKKLKEMGESEIAIIALISSSLRTMQKIKIGLENGLPKQDIISSGKINPYSYSINYNLCSKLSLKTINSLVDKLFNLDNRIKLGKVTEESMLTLLMLEIGEEITNV